MSSKDYASTPKIPIDQRLKPLITLDDALVEFVDYDAQVGDWDTQGAPDGDSLDGDSTLTDDGTIDPGSGGGDGGGPGTTIIDVPQLIPGTIIQTPRVMADGTTVVDVTFQVTDVYGATKYDVRVTT